MHTLLAGRAINHDQIKRFIYRTRANKSPAAYKTLKVSRWRTMYLKILGFLPKNSLNNWTFGAKKWWVNQIWLYWWFYWEWRGYGMHSLTMRTKNTWPMFILLCIRSGKLSRHFTDKSLQCVIKNDLYTSLFTPNTEYTLPLDESNSNMISIGTKCIFNCTCFRVHLTI